MIEQSRLAQMGEMISMIAHQWRQPLAAISATSVNMNFQAQLGKLDDEKIIELSEKISGYSQHLSATIDDFRDFFKSNKVAKETSFLEIIDSVTNIIEVSILNSNIDLIKNINNNDPFVTYVNEVKQVVLNLMKNAEDVLIEKEIVSPRITVTTFKYQEKFIFEIADNGGGIDEKVLDSIFDPYVTTKKNSDGTGLGLYMSKIIIEEHCNGKLTARNNHEGAVFQIILGPTI